MLLGSAAGSKGGRCSASLPPLNGWDGPRRISDSLAQPAMLWISFLPKVPVHHVGEAADLLWRTYEACRTSILNRLSEPARCCNQEGCCLHHLDRYCEVRDRDRTASPLVCTHQSDLGKHLSAVQDIHPDVILGQILTERQAIR